MPCVTPTFSWASQTIPSRFEIPRIGSNNREFHEGLEVDESLVKMDIGLDIVVDMMLEIIMVLVLGLTTIVPEVVLTLELAVVVMDLMDFTVLNPTMVDLEILDLQMVRLYHTRTCR